jgi:hypothetical protein
MTALGNAAGNALNAAALQDGKLPCLQRSARSFSAVARRDSRQLQQSQSLRTQSEKSVAAKPDRMQPRGHRLFN